MTERNTSSERLSERDVDRLLQDFFHDEVPAEFRRDEPAVTLAQPQVDPIVRTATSDSSRSLAGLLGILVSATCCLVVTMFIPGTPAPSDENSPAAPTMAGENDRHNKPVTEEESAPVEERDHIRYTTMGNHEAEPGSESEKTGPLEPELEIEIFPLRPDKPRE
jgi:hypothetical protein